MPGRPSVASLKWKGFPMEWHGGIYKWLHIKKDYSIIAHEKHETKNLEIYLIYVVYASLTKPWEKKQCTKQLPCLVGLWCQVPVPVGHLAEPQWGDTGRIVRTSPKMKCCQLGSTGSQNVLNLDISWPKPYRVFVTDSEVSSILVSTYSQTNWYLRSSQFHSWKQMPCLKHGNQRQITWIHHWFIMLNSCLSYFIIVSIQWKPGHQTIFSWFPVVPHSGWRPSCVLVFFKPSIIRCVSAATVCPSCAWEIDGSSPRPTL